MNWDAIAAISETLGAIGIISSLLFVGMQIRRDQHATLAETSYRRQNAARELLVAVITSPDIAGIMAKVGGTILHPGVSILVDKFGLEAEEAIKLASFYAASLRISQSTLKMAISDAERRDTVAFLKNMMQGDAMNVWWDNGKRDFDADFVALVDQERAAA